MDAFEHNGQLMSFSAHGTGAPVTIWAHGWGRDRSDLLPLAQGSTLSGRHIVVDFPGFGQSPRPKADWWIGDYADFMHAFIVQQCGGSCLWVGHSFGGRVGVRLAARYPDAVHKMALIAAHGLKTRRSVWKNILIAGKVRVFKTLKILARSPQQLERLRSRFGSADYKTAGAMRPIFLNVLSETLENDAAQIVCPVTLIYGEADSETPPDMGARYHALIKGSEFHVLPGLDHYTLLSSGRHRTLKHLKTFFES